MYFLLDGVVIGACPVAAGIELCLPVRQARRLDSRLDTFTPSTRRLLVLWKIGTRARNTSHIRLYPYSDAFAFGTAQSSNKCKTDRKCTSD